MRLERCCSTCCSARWSQFCSQNPAPSGDSHVPINSVPGDLVEPEKNTFSGWTCHIDRISTALLIHELCFSSVHSMVLKVNIAIIITYKTIQGIFCQQKYHFKLLGHFLFHMCVAWLDIQIYSFWKLISKIIMIMLIPDNCGLHIWSVGLVATSFVT